MTTASGMEPRGITSEHAPAPLPPLVVDLDGTLLYTDMLHESVLQVFKEFPTALLRGPFWLANGKAFLKQQLAVRSPFSPKSLPFNFELIAWLKSERASGRRLVLCTASDHSIAQSIADHLGLFDQVIASDGHVNMAGERKAAALEQAFGLRGFDYAGNSRADVAVWKRARQAIVVNASAAVTRSARHTGNVARVFARQDLGVHDARRVLRVHQWLKNLLLFVPLIAAHQLNDEGAWLALLLAFVAFSLCASSVYIANDLLDLDSDRQHPRKRNRPFASGRVPIKAGIFLAPILIVASGSIALQLRPAFCVWLMLYFVLTCAYSWTLKKRMVVDCIALAMLYTIRIIAGAAAVGMSLSFWLLAFGVFLFLSLAFVKRYAELEVQLLSGKTKVHGRGYYTTDAPLIQSTGVASGYASVLVLALYLNSDAVVRLYEFPEMVWGTVPIMLFWISWLWMRAHRGQMHDDPLVFAVSDRASLIAGGLFAVVLAIGSVGWPW